jgi:hypothetical protein
MVSQKITQARGMGTSCPALSGVRGPIGMAVLMRWGWETKLARERKEGIQGLEGKTAGLRRLVALTTVG